DLVRRRLLGDGRDHPAQAGGVRRRAGRVALTWLGSLVPLSPVLPALPEPRRLTPRWPVRRHRRRAEPAPTDDLLRQAVLWDKALSLEGVAAPRVGRSGGNFAGRSRLPQTICSGRLRVWPKSRDPRNILLEARWTLVGKREAGVWTRKQSPTQNAI